MGPFDSQCSAIGVVPSVARSSLTDFYLHDSICDRNFSSYPSIYFDDSHNSRNSGHNSSHTGKRGTSNRRNDSCKLTRFDSVPSNVDDPLRFCPIECWRYIDSLASAICLYTQRKIQRFTLGTCRTFHALQVPRDSRSSPNVPGSAAEPFTLSRRSSAWNARLPKVWAAAPRASESGSADLSM